MGGIHRVLEWEGLPPYPLLALQPVQVGPSDGYTRKELSVTVRRPTNTFYSGVRGYEWVYALSSSPWTTYGPYSLSAQDYIESTGHDWKPEGPNPGDVGGYFSLVKRTYSGNCSSPTYVRKADSSRPSGSGAGAYEGPQFPSGGYNDFPSSAASSDAQLLALGTTAIARCAPTHPASDVASFLGELSRDGMPSIPGLEERTRHARNAGDEYLNLEFGWKPLLSDVREIAHAVKKSDKILRDYRAGSGKQTRRQYRFPTEYTVSKLTEQTGVPASPAVSGWLYSSGTGRLIVNETTQVDRWFSGAFTYFLDPGDDLAAKFKRHAQEANKLFGTTISPATLWNLAPWSWAADWFANTGDLLANVSAAAFDGQVLRYGYVMEHTIRKRNVRLEGVRFINDPRPRVMEMNFTVETKKRLPATPFGFGLIPSAFTPRQWAIVAALGISRKPRAL